VRQSERAVVKSLVAACWADGQVTDEERQMLGNILAHLGFDHQELLEVGQMMTEKPAPGDIGRQIPDYETRRELLRSVLAVTLADQGVDPLERRFLRKMAAELEVGEQELQELLRETREVLKAQQS
jgi:uncharacterized membrane protein YebE (DUF533 family)